MEKKMIPPKRVAEKGAVLHTLDWYQENWGVDPLKLNIPSILFVDPHIPDAPPVKLWKESDVLPFMYETGLTDDQKRRRRYLKAVNTRKENLTNWFEEVKTDNPKVREIMSRLLEIRKELKDLRRQKELCKEDNKDDKRAYLAFREKECEDCEIISKKQRELREERSDLIEELVSLTGVSSAAVKLVRTSI